MAPTPQAPTPAKATAPVAGRPPMREPQRAAQREDLSFLAEGEDGSSPFYIDPARVPDGMSYEWCRVTYAGKDDHRNQARRQRHRWTPVPNRRHPELVGSLATEKADAAIIIDGLMLMERPSHLTDFVAERQTVAAKERVRNQVKSLKLTPDGQMDRKVIAAKKKYNIQVAEPDEAGEDEE